jgi:hypothetical protein
VASPSQVATVCAPEESSVGVDVAPGAASLPGATLESGQGFSPARGPLVVPGPAEGLCGPVSSSTPPGPNQQQPPQLGLGVEHLHGAAFDLILECFQDSSVSD